jgi:hypothetical protein
MRASRSLFTIASDFVIHHILIDRRCDTQYMGEPCGSWAKTPNRPCRRQVKVGCAPCWQHRRAALQSIPHPRGSHVPRRSHLSHGPRLAHAHHESDTITDVTLDITFNVASGKSWTDATKDKFVELIGERLVSELYRKRPKGGCKPLADLADTLLNAQSKITNTALDIVGCIFKPLKRKTIERKIAEKLINQISFGVSYKLKTVARALQALGICLCVSQDNLPLDQKCDCWRQVKKELTRNLIQFELDQAVDQLLDYNKDITSVRSSSRQ